MTATLTGSLSLTNGNALSVGALLRTKNRHGISALTAGRKWTVRGKKNDGRNWQVDDYNRIHSLHERNIHTTVFIYMGVRKE